MVNRKIHYATKKLREYREDRDWSQEKLADFLTLQTGISVTRANIQSWESQANGMKADVALEIANVLKIPIMELVEQRVNSKES